MKSQFDWLGSEHMTHRSNEAMIFSRKLTILEGQGRQKLTGRPTQHPLQRQSHKVAKHVRLTFTEHATRCTDRARSAERRLRPIVNRHGVHPISARHLQEAIIGLTLMYGAEVTWRGQAGMADSSQRTLNRVSWEPYK